MLVLSRKVGDKIVIDNKITIIVTKISGNRVTMAINAPDDVRVLRGELKEYEVTPAIANHVHVESPAVSEPCNYSI